MKYIIFFLLISINSIGQEYVRVLHGSTLWMVKADGTDSMQVPSTDKSGFSIIGHYHTIAKITGLQAALDAKGVSNFDGNYSSLIGAPDASLKVNVADTSGRWAALVHTHTLAALGLGNVTNTSDANKPVSTAQQTALDLKANAATNTGDNAANSLYSGLVTNANHAGDATGSTTLTLATVNSNVGAFGSAAQVPAFTVNGKGLITAVSNTPIVLPITAITNYTGYTLAVQALTSSPTDAQTIYFGNLPKAPVTSQGTSRIYVRQAGTIKRVEIYCQSGTAGSNEAWPLSIRLNNSGDTQIASLSVSTSERVWSNTALSIAVVVGDYIEIKSVNPTWATNPLTTIFGGYIYIE